MRPASKQRVSSVVSINAPTGGIDDSTPVANMGTEFAIAMLNWYPEGSALRVREGYREQATLIDKPVETLMAYRAVNPANNKLFAVSDDGIYDVTTPGASPTLVKALTNGRVQWTQFGNIAGNWLIGCNGTDPAFLYNGTTWIDFVIDAAPAAPGEIDGLDPTTIVSVVHHKNRIWFTVKDSLTAYYMPLNAVAGVVTAFPLGGIAQQGGYLNTAFTWTMDAGYSVDDMLVFQTSVGELLTYSGTDPSEASTWFLNSRYFAGAPMSRRSHAALNGDMLLMTEFGLVSMAKVAAGQQSAGAKEMTTSARISNALNSLIRARTGATAWEVVYSPSLQYLVLTVPAFSGESPVQYVMNPVTGAWTTFDLPAVTFLEFDGFLYFSDATGRVLRHGGVSLDDVKLDGTGGEQITAGFKQAYDYMGSPGTHKAFKLIKPVFEAQISPAYRIGISADFSPVSYTDLLNPGAADAAASVAIWDVSYWGEGEWAQPLLAFQEWVGLAEVGYCASIIARVQVSATTRYVASNIAFEAGISI